MPLLAGLYPDEVIKGKTVSFLQENGLSCFMYLIENVNVVNEGKVEKKSVLIENGLVSQISDHIPHTEGVSVINGEGKYLLPGVIDTHVHFRDPGLTVKADFYTESCAALAGGVTSVIDMPNTKPQTVSEQTLDEKLAMAAEKSLVNYGFMVGATNGNIGEISSIDPRKYAAIKLFMGSSTGNMLVNSDSSLEDLFASARKVIVAHCEDEERIRERTDMFRNAGSNSPNIHPKIRDAESCFISTQKAVALAKKYNARLHVAHLSTGKELSLFSSESLENKNVTAEVTPNHLWFCDDDYQRLGNLIRCNPAIKSANDREALRNALKDNIIDTIATDHAPHCREEKMRPYFESVSGMPSIQHSLLVMLELVKRNVIDIGTLVEKMCHNPARLFSIENRGFIREGYAADLVLVDMGSETQVTAESLYYKCRWSPLEGETFSSKVLRTFVNGIPAYDCENGIFESIRGRSLKFSR